MKNILYHRVLPLIVVLAMALIGGTYLSTDAQSQSAPGSAAVQSTPKPQKPDSPAATAEPQSGSEQPEAPQGGEETQESQFFTLSFVGDCTLASVQAYVGTPSGYDGVVGDNYAYPFEKTVQYFEDDDFTFANLECALTNSGASKPGKTFVFKCSPEYAKIMSAGSVECVTLANNHIEDYLDQGIKDTEAALDAEGIAHVGRSDKGMVDTIIYETERGLKIGVYANSFGTIDGIKNGIKKLQDMGAEFIIAAIHLGDEGSYNPNAEQISQAHAAVDAGADFVYISHAHTLQPREQYNGAWIYYSMGNWSFGGNTDPRDKDTFFLQLKVEKTPDGEVKVVDRVEVPCASSGTVNGNNYQPVVVEEGTEQYQRIMDKLNGKFEGQNLGIGYGYGGNE